MYTVPLMTACPFLSHGTQDPIGRCRAAILATLLALPVAYTRAFSGTALFPALGAFLMQVCVQGAFSGVPAHLNELSPADARGTFSGACYRPGNLIASVNAVIQTRLAEKLGGNYSLILAATAASAALLIVILTKFGPEAHGIELRGQQAVHA